METVNTFNRQEVFSVGEFFMKGLGTETEDKQELIPLVIGGKTSALDNL